MAGTPGFCTIARQPKDFYSLLAWKKHGNMKTEDWVELADVIVGCRQ
jgi:hypothetical protein